MRYLTIGVLALLVACGGNDATAPDVLHVANVSYTESTTCNSASCSGTVRFRLLTQASAGRAGQVRVTGDGWEPVKTVATVSDGWGEVEWGFDPYHRPITITVCPAGVTDNTRCGTVSTG